MSQTVLPAGPSCALCRRGPARRISAHRQVGLLIIRRHISYTDYLCRDHGRKALLKYTGRTLIQGWWGAISMFTNAIFVVVNVVQLPGVLRMPRPTDVLVDTSNHVPSALFTWPSVQPSAVED